MTLPAVMVNEVFKNSYLSDFRPLFLSFLLLYLSFTIPLGRFSKVFVNCPQTSGMWLASHHLSLHFTEVCRATEAEMKALPSDSPRNVLTGAFRGAQPVLLLLKEHPREVTRPGPLAQGGPGRKHCAPSTRTEPFCKQPLHKLHGHFCTDLHQRGRLGFLKEPHWLILLGYVAPDQLCPFFVKQGR